MDKLKHEEAVKIIKNQFITVGKSVLINALSVYIPPLKVPPLSWVANHYAEKIMNTLANEAEMAAFMAYTNFNVDSQGRAFMEAAINNHKIQTIGTDEQKKQSEQALKDSFRKLVKFSN